MTEEGHKRKIHLEAFGRKPPISWHPKFLFFFLNKITKVNLNPGSRALGGESLQNKHKLLRVARGAEPFAKLSGAGAVPARAPSVGLSLCSEPGSSLRPRPGQGTTGPGATQSGLAWGWWARLGEQPLLEEVRAGQFLPQEGLCPHPKDLCCTRAVEGRPGKCAGLV